jgi:5-methylcytosine-specific restriction protein B
MLETRFKEEAYPVHSFPELSLAAWFFKDTVAPPPLGDDDQDNKVNTQETEEMDAPIEPYFVDDILADGCFLERAVLEKLLERLRTKKNLILQGPPGTGKTWLAKRLAFALMGQRDDSKVRALQFHPNLSYEDFVRGWRPSGEGKLSLVDGPFMEMINAASKEPSIKYVVVIEEINRGNPAQIFGEMLTLLEADKRTPNEALELCYRREVGERVHIPDNMYVIGTMNIADRSLALVDLALRRRFAFVELEPTLGKVWHNWVNKKCGIDSEILTEIEERILALNKEITADTSLGRQFRIGHSYVTPPFKIPITDAREWFKQVVETEIGPLLDEYWFDALDKARNARQRLIEGL